MSVFDQPPLHDFGDRAIRELLQDPRNLSDLLTARLPDLAARFDLNRAQLVEPEFLLDDWRRRTADLLHTPSWQPLIWDLSEQTAQELQEAEGAWLKALAVVRADREEANTFRGIMDEVLRRLEPLSDRDNMRWHNLVRFVLSWAFWRRPGSERRELVAVAQQSQLAAAHREAVMKLNETIERTWPEELLAQGLAEGETRGRIREARENLRALLQEKFGALPEEWTQKIEATQDLERLKDALRQVLHIQTLAELTL